MRSALTRSRLKTIVQSFPSLKIAVLGDFALDAYWHVDMQVAQLSREVPVFNRPVVQEQYSMGGAANVAWNLADLGIKDVHAFSALGEDWRAVLLRDLMQKNGIRADGCIASPAWSTLLFAKILLSAGGLQQEDSRIDFINSNPLEPECETALYELLETRLPGLNALIISDYQPTGVINDKMLGQLNILAEKHPEILFVVDSRERIENYRNMILKPNLSEALKAAKISTNHDLADGSIAAQAGQFLQAGSKKPVFVTLGDRGCLIVDPNSSIHIPSPKISGPIDTVGAGDSFLAALTASLAASASPAEAATIASLAAGVTIKKINTTGTASPDEILALFDECYSDTKQ